MTIDLCACVVQIVNLLKLSHPLTLLYNVPVTPQVILLSATMPPDVLEVTTRFMRDPIRILVKKEELTLEGIKQFFIQVEKEVWTYF